MYVTIALQTGSSPSNSCSSYSCNSSGGISKLMGANTVGGDIRDHYSMEAYGHATNVVNQAREREIGLELSRWIY